MRKLLIAVLLVLAAPLLAAPSQMASITTEAQFDALARTSPGGRYASFAQVMFVIDRAAKGGPELHFVNSRQYEYHIDFVQRTYLSTQSVEALLDANYSKDNRRFIFGSIVHYQSLGRYGVEFWEGDVLTREILSETMEQLQRNFPAPLGFKPNSEQQSALAATVPGLATIDQNDVTPAAANWCSTPAALPDGCGSSHSWTMMCCSPRPISSCWAKHRCG